MKANASSDGIVPEEFSCPPSLVSDNETLFSASLDFEDLHHGAITRLDAPENFLVDLKRVVRRFLEEHWIGDSPDVSLSARFRGG